MNQIALNEWNEEETGRTGKLATDGALDGKPGVPMVMIHIV